MSALVTRALNKVSVNVNSTVFNFTDKQCAFDPNVPVLEIIGICSNGLASQKIKNALENVQLPFASANDIPRVDDSSLNSFLLYIKQHFDLFKQIAEFKIPETKEIKTDAELLAFCKQSQTMHPIENFANVYDLNVWHRWETKATEISTYIKSVEKCWYLLLFRCFSTVSIVDILNTKDVDLPFFPTRFQHVKIRMDWFPFAHASFIEKIKQIALPDNLDSCEKVAREWELRLNSLHLENESHLQTLKTLINKPFFTADQTSLLSIFGPVYAEFKIQALNDVEVLTTLAYFLSAKKDVGFVLNYQVPSRTYKMCFGTYVDTLLNRMDCIKQWALFINSNTFFAENPRESIGKMWDDKVIPDNFKPFMKSFPMVNGEFCSTDWFSKDDRIHAELAHNTTLLWLVLLFSEHFKKDFQNFFGSEFDALKDKSNNETLKSIFNKLDSTNKFQNDKKYMLPIWKHEFQSFVKPAANPVEIFKTSSLLTPKTPAPRGAPFVGATPKVPTVSLNPTGASSGGAIPVLSASLKPSGPPSGGATPKSLHAPTGQPVTPKLPSAPTKLLTGAAAPKFTAEGNALIQAGVSLERLPEIRFTEWTTNNKNSNYNVFEQKNVNYQFADNENSKLNLIKTKFENLFKGKFFREDLRSFLNKSTHNSRSCD